MSGHPSRIPPSATGTLAKVFCLLVINTHLAHAAEISPRISGPDYPTRSAAVIRYFASAESRTPLFPKDAMPFYAARLETGTDIPTTLRRIDAMLDATLTARLDPFNLHACIHAYLRHKPLFPPALREKIKRFAATFDYSRPAGVSLNYELMRSGSGYLAAHEWPDLRDAAGNDAAKILKNCEGWLWRIWRETPDRNASEYDAPVYYGTDFAPARMLAEFAPDPTFRLAAKMTLDFMLIQTGAHWHHGYHVSSAGRGKYWGSLNLGPDAAAPTNGMAFLFYGSSRPFNIASAPQTYWLAHPGQALSPELLSSWQASLPDERTVLATHLWPSHNAIVHKYTWFSEGYGLASQREDGTTFSSFLFKECRRTMLKWHSPQPASTFTVIQENRRRPHEKIRNAFAYGENPYTQVFQVKGTLIGVHDVPEDYGFWITRAPFTTTGAIIRRQEKDGWILAHGGSMLFAFRFTQPARWDTPETREKLDLWRCDARRGGWILETAPIDDFAGGTPDEALARFATAITRCRIHDETASSPPRLAFTNLAGVTLDLNWKPLADPLGDALKVNGKPTDFSKYSLLATHHTRQPNGGPLTLTLPSGKSVTYDFKNWKITHH